jgi:hypothetical protein
VGEVRRRCPSAGSGGVSEGRGCARFVEGDPAQARAGCQENAGARGSSKVTQRRLSLSPLGPR